MICKSKFLGIQGFLEEAQGLLSTVSMCNSIPTDKAEDGSPLQMKREIFTRYGSYWQSFTNPIVTVKNIDSTHGVLLAAWRYRLEKAGLVSTLGNRSRIILLSDGIELIRNGDYSTLIELLAEDFVLSQSQGILQSLGVNEDWDSPFSGGEAWLLRRGVAISEHDLTLFKHIMSLKSTTSHKIASAVVDGYLGGFYDDGKSLDGKKTVAVSMSPGFAPLMKIVEEKLCQHDLKLLSGCYKSTTEPIQQLHDHKYDWALFLNPNLVEKTLAGIEQALTDKIDRVQEHSGIIHIMTFGERQARLKNSSLTTMPCTEQNMIYRDFLLRKQELVNRFIPRSSTSYTGIAFPMPDIGSHFQEVFSDMVTVNTLDSRVYGEIQSTIITALDKAESVRIMGSNGNRTNITISMHHLPDPAIETNFLNCLATINIPLGEVFTSPVLKGTTGLLHVKDIFLEEIQFKDLVLTFTDGYVTDYSCSNLGTEEENRRLVYETLLHPHETLPMGEFAIGTNTAAYSMAEKHGIADLLPVLVAEKMGPHIAIGDTCFSRRENTPCYSDGKEMKARFNEKTANAAQDPTNAYTSTHKDITLPYHSIMTLKSIHADGSETEIISSGHFVLPGTELLNSYLDM